MSRALSVGFQDRLYQRHPDYAVVEAKVAAATASEGRMTTAALEEILQAIKVDTELLEHENAMFQSYITCVAGSEPQQLRVTPDALSNSATDDDASEASEGSVTLSLWKTGADRGPKHRGLRLQRRQQHKTERNSPPGQPRGPRSVFRGGAETRGCVGRA